MILNGGFSALSTWAQNKIYNENKSVGASFLSGVVKGFFTSVTSTSAERDAERATRTLFTKVAAWGQRWGSNGFKRITNYYSQVTCTSAILKGLRAGAIRSTVEGMMKPVIETMANRVKATIKPQST